jgi:hypothetical protein
MVLSFYFSWEITQVAESWQILQRQYMIVYIRNTCQCQMRQAGKYNELLLPALESSELYRSNWHKTHPHTETSKFKKSSVFCDITSWSLLKVNRCFRGTCCSISKQSSACYLLHAGLFTGLALQSCRWTWHVPLKRRLTFSRLHDVISQNSS